MAKQSNIFLVGPMGAGKTSIGRALAHELKLSFRDSDQEIEARTGADVPWIFELEGEAGFRKREAQVIADLASCCGIVLATGGGSILMPENRTILAANGIVIYLKTSIEQQMNRTAYGSKRPLANDLQKRLDNFIAMKKIREPLYEEIADLSYDTGNWSVSLAVQHIIRALNERRLI